MSTDTGGTGTASSCDGLSSIRSPSRREQAAIVAALAADGLTIPEIARVLGVPRERVLGIAVKFGIRIRSADKRRRA
jgi:hypothetical protein